MIGTTRTRILLLCYFSAATLRLPRIEKGNAKAGKILDVAGGDRQAVLKSSGRDDAILDRQWCPSPLRLSR